MPGFTSNDKDPSLDIPPVAANRAVDGSSSLSGTPAELDEQQFNPGMKRSSVPNGSDDTSPRTRHLSNGTSSLVLCEKTYRRSFRGRDRYMQQTHGTAAARRQPLPRGPVSWRWIRGGPDATNLGGDGRCTPVFTFVGGAAGRHNRR